MDLERIQARIEPRDPWQAMDLGARMLQSWWRPLLGIWLLFTLVPFTVLMLITDRDNFFLATLGFWLLKPLWEKPLLEYCSRALFGERPGALQLLREFPRYGFTGLFSMLSLRRLSPSRSFNMPVFQLERSRGEKLGRRLRILHLPPSSRAGALTIVTLHIEQGLAFGFIILVYMLAPWQFNLELADWLLMRERTHQLIGAGSWYLAMCLTEPLYVSAGFALYLNKRTWLEAWDLDLGLRRIGRRRAAAGTGVAALLVLIPMLWISPADAEPAPAEQAPQQQAVELLAGPDFMPMNTERRWRQREWLAEQQWLDQWLEWLWQEDDAGQSDEAMALPVLADIARFVLVVLLISLLIWLVWRYRDLLAAFASGGSRQSLPTSVAGLDIRPESLPDDIGKAVRNALASRDPRGALGLLYRATLSRLIHELRLPLHPGTTEQECLALLRRRLGDDPRLALMETLTPLWIATAWAHRRPGDRPILDCLAQWQTIFENGEPEAIHAPA